jgi:radical SAM protein with 4Fe4S-binding SPASM domain
MTQLRRAGYQIAAHAESSGVPVSMTFQVTDRCNYRCAHCYQEHTKRPELGTEEIFDILGQAAELGVLFLTLMGGEFFMRRDADAILEKAHELGFAIRVLTTGHHIHDRRADFLATMQPLQIDLSVYGPKPEIHQQITLQDGSWQRTLDAARRLIARKVPVQLKTPVMEFNAPHVAELRALAADIGAMFSCDAKVTGMENSDQSPVTLRMRGETLQAFYRDSEKTLGDGIETLFGRADRQVHHSPCSAGQQSCSVNPQGDVWPCNALPIAMGNLRESRLRDIWFGSTELEEIRRLKWADLSECRVCPVRSYCSRCHAMALLEQGNLRGPSLEACRHAVAIRDALRDKGLIPAGHTAMPPTWDRVDKDGQHHNVARRGVRSTRLRVV